MRQGSILSPRLFSIFIDDLLQQLKYNGNGMKIYNLKLNAIEYANDINLFSITTTGLQELIGTCAHVLTNGELNSIQPRPHARE